MTFKVSFFVNLSHHYDRLMKTDSGSFRYENKKKLN